MRVHSASASPHQDLDPSGISLTVAASGTLPSASSASMLGASRASSRRLPRNSYHGDAATAWRLSTSVLDTQASDVDPAAIAQVNQRGDTFKRNADTAIHGPSPHQAPSQPAQLQQACSARCCEPAAPPLQLLRMLRPQSGGPELHHYTCLGQSGAGTTYHYTCLGQSGAGTTRTTPSIMSAAAEEQLCSAATVPGRAPSLLPSGRFATAAGALSGPPGSDSRTSRCSRVRSLCIAGAPLQPGFSLPGGEPRPYRSSSSQPFVTAAALGQQHSGILAFNNAPSRRRRMSSTVGDGLAKFTAGNAHMMPLWAARAPSNASGGAAAPGNEGTKRVEAVLLDRGMLNSAAAAASRSSREQRRRRLSVDMVAPPPHVLMHTVRPTSGRAPYTYAGAGYTPGASSSVISGARSSSSYSKHQMIPPMLETHEDGGAAPYGSLRTSRSSRQRRQSVGHVQHLQQQALLVQRLDEAITYARQQHLQQRSSTSGYRTSSKNHMRA